ncbi:hypothetical protein [Streptomyces sp. BBFR102]|uniref:hypothetical protein n=1 Tax=Streptomyces sp. BBFR102 TaxID=3448171 RepID=UPI003F52FEAC
MSDDDACCADADEPEVPEAVWVVGAFAVDVRDGRLGRVMGSEGPYIQLRPPGGGKEWDCPPRAVRAADRKEVLRAKVREINWEGRLP